MRNGNFRYKKEGQLGFVSKNNVPIDELERLHSTSQLPKEVVAAEEAVDASKLCLFCGQYTRISRFINLQTIPLCEEHYQNQTTGKIVQKLRELQQV